MASRTWTTVPLAGLLAVMASGCAGQKKETAAAPPNPAAERVQVQQQAAQQAIKEAKDAQQKANDQAQKAAQARADVRQKQQDLQQAQQTAKQEVASAEKLQQEANVATQRATTQVRQTQELATAGLARQSKLMEEGLQTTAGQVMSSTAKQLVLRPAGGPTLTLRVNDKTQFQVDGRRAHASDVKLGDEARVAYSVSGMKPTATVVQVMTGNVPGVSAKPPKAGAPANGGAGGQ
jgi:hypothetical protein